MVIRKHVLQQKTIEGALKDRKERLYLGLFPINDDKKGILMVFVIKLFLTD